MVDRTRILVIGDGNSPTGFARLLQSILTRLPPRFDIHSGKPGSAPSSGPDGPASTPHGGFAVAGLHRRVAPINRIVPQPTFPGAPAPPHPAAPTCRPMVSPIAITVT